MDSPLFLALGLVTFFIGIVGLGVLFGSLSGRRAVAPGRRRPIQTAPSGGLTKLTDAAVGAINKSLQGRQLRVINADKFEQAGLKIRAGDFLLMSGAGALAGAVLGFILGGLGLALLLVILVPVGLLLGLNMMASRRQAKFADQLPDTLQMLAGSMRAGHSLLRAVDGAATESEIPMAQELQRIVNETRIGRDLTDSLIDTASRMKSQDFLWVAQAIETHREVGGNLAELIDNVNETIRERGQVSRQVRALSAEGRTSAVVLVALPIVLFVLISFMNPSYVAVFFTTLPGWIMLAAVVLLLVVGSFWLSRLIKPKF